MLLSLVSLCTVILGVIEKNIESLRKVSHYLSNTNIKKILKTHCKGTIITAHLRKLIMCGI